MSRLGWRFFALCCLILASTLVQDNNLLNDEVLADEVLANDVSANDPASSGATSEFNAKDLIQSWNRLAPKIEFSEKWRTRFPIGPFDRVVWAGDAERIAALTGDSEVLVVDSADGRELTSFSGRAEDRTDCEGAQGRPRCIAISNDGKHVAIGFTAGVAIWDWSADKVAFVHKEPMAVRDMRISDDGKWLCLLDSRVVGGRFGLLDGTAGRTFTLSRVPGGGAFKVLMDPSGDRMAFRGEPLGHYIEVAMAQPDGQGVNISPVAGNGSNKFAMGKRVRIAGNDDGGLIVYMRRDLPLLTADDPDTVVAGMPHASHGPIMAKLRDVMVSPDDLWGIAYDYNDRIAMIRIDVACPQWRGRLPQGRIVAVRPQLNEVAAVEPSGEMVCHSITFPTDHPAHDCEKWFRDALTRQAYDEIDAVAKAVASDREPFAFWPHASKFEALRTVLKSVPPDQEQAERIGGQLKTFQIARPQNPLIVSMEAKRLIDEGWKARGSGFADVVLPTQREAFRQLIDQAQAMLKPLMEGDEPPLDLYQPWFAIARAANWPRADVDSHVEKLLRRLDGYHPALGEAAVLLLPRWGGKPGEASEFAKRVADRFSGDAGDVAYARIAMSLAPYEKEEPSSAPGSNKSGVLDFDVERATRGVLLVIEREPYSRELLAQCKLYNGVLRSSKIAEALSKKTDPAD